jgi:hypothetical protein
MMYREIMIVCCENDTKDVVQSVGKNAGCSLVTGTKI